MMSRSKINRLLGACALLLFIVQFFPPLDNLLDRDMSSNLLIQLPVIILSGLALSRIVLSRHEAKMILLLSHWNWLGLSGLIFFIGSLSFWMIPRSVDLAVSYNHIDWLMQLNLFLAGCALGFSLPVTPFVLRIGAGIYGLAMWLGSGYTYYKYESLLCAVYNLEMQQTTGFYMLQIFPLLVVLFLYRFINNLRRAGEMFRK